MTTRPRSVAVPPTSAPTVVRHLTPVLDEPDDAGWDDLREAYAEAPVGMAVLRHDGVVVSTNSTLAALLQRPESDLVGRSFLDLTHPDDHAAAKANCEGMTAGRTRVARQECRFLTPSGAVQWVLVSTSRPTEAPGRPPHLIMHIEDISARKAYEEDLVRRTLHDPLTGLPNRVMLLDRLGHALDVSRRSGTATSLLFIDLDGFKTVNDVHGHAAGDAVLVQFAERLLAAVRPGDTAGRLGGDEFLVLCEDTASAEAHVLADRLAALAGRPFDVGDAGLLTLGAAVGVGTALPDGPDGVVRPEQLLALADIQMYEQKRVRAGRPPA